MIEEWRVIEEAPKYSVSNLGRVRRDAPGSGTQPGNILNQHDDPGGYLQVRLMIDDDHNSRLFRVHRLVLKAFVGHPPTSKHDAAHWDGVRKNNNLENLRWATRKENLADRRRHGTGTQFTPDKIDQIKQMREIGMTQYAIADAMGVAQSSVWRVLHGRP